MSIIEYLIPYGSKNLELKIANDKTIIDLLVPSNTVLPVKNPLEAVQSALSYPIGCSQPFFSVNPDTHVAITVNDKTRPVPNALLLTPLLEKLHSFGVKSSNITFFIASGTHLPMTPDEILLLLGPEITNEYRIIPHNSDDCEHLCAIGTTSRQTPVFVNKDFNQHDLKIVVGDIELHHFAGYSGGVKPAAIGLSGRETINTNHKLLLDENSVLGKYEGNPLREDIEEIGRMMKVDLALNAVLNERKEILGVFFGNPVAVIQAGIKLVNEITQVTVYNPYDLVIASAGGYPKDINLYQAQKAMTHGSMFCKPGGILLLIAECVEGAGSTGYLEFMQGIHSVGDIIEKFEKSVFMVGPHKAYQIARILQKHQVYLFSSIPADIVKSLLLKPIRFPSEINDLIHKSLLNKGRVALLPYATACIPSFDKGAP